jgi:hypothetical protein
MSETKSKNIPPSIRLPERLRKDLDEESGERRKKHLPPYFGLILQEAWDFWKAHRSDPIKSPSMYPEAITCPICKSSLSISPGGSAEVITQGVLPKSETPGAQSVPEELGEWAELLRKVFRTDDYVKIEAIKWNLLEFAGVRGNETPGESSGASGKKRLSADDLARIHGEIRAAERLAQEAKRIAGSGDSHAKTHKGSRIRNRNPKTGSD